MLLDPERNTLSNNKINSSPAKVVKGLVSYFNEDNNDASKDNAIIPTINDPTIPHPAIFILNYLCEIFFQIEFGKEYI